MSAIITDGVLYPLYNLSEQIRQEDLEYMISRENYTLVIHVGNEVTFLVNYEKEIRKDWILPDTL